MSAPRSFRHFTAGSLLAAVAGFAFAPQTIAAASHFHPAAVMAAGEVQSAASVDGALRQLWEGHAFLVRNVVIETIDGNRKAADLAEAAAVANAKAIASAIAPYYGDKASDELFKLLAGHYGGIKAYLVAAVAKDDKKKNAAIAAINDNAEQIAAFLSGANPNLPKDDVLGLLQAHAGHHLTQIQQLIAKDYAGEFQTLTDMRDHMQVIADALANAIAKQFPDKFKA